MTREEIEQAAETLEAFQKWRTGEDDRTIEDAGIVAGEVTKAIDTVLAAFNQPPTGHKPCANFCEHIALKHEIKRLKNIMFRFYEAKSSGDSHNEILAMSEIKQVAQSLTK